MVVINVTSLIQTIKLHATNDKNKKENTMIKQNKIGKGLYTLEVEDIADYWGEIEYYVLQAAKEDYEQGSMAWCDDFVEQYYNGVGITDEEREIDDNIGGTYYFDYNLLSKERTTKLINNVQQRLTKILKEED